MSERVTHVGAYRVERELRRDEQHIVYQGWQTSLNRPVQITQLTREAAADSDFVARWKLAARDLRDPGHPQLPRILDAQFAGEQPYLVESYLIADTLADQLGRSRDLEGSLRLLTGLAGALAYAHQRGWAHGQLTPEQVRIADDGAAYLLDLSWQAAQRPKGDAAAMQADVRALAGMFCRLREPVAGPAPDLTGWPGEDEEALAAWLGQGQPPEAAPTALALAPVLAWALSGSIADAAQLGEALRPLLPTLTVVEQPRAEGPRDTIVAPPPGASSRPPTPAPVTSPPSPPPVVYPSPQAPYAGYAPPPPAQRSSSRRGVGALVGAAAILLALAVGGVLLCQAEVLPFCTSCNEGLIAQYVSGAQVYVSRAAWGDAQRELEAARVECNACRTAPAACVEVTTLLDQTTCVGSVDRLTAEGETLLANGDACAAVPKLEQAISQAETCGADAGMATAMLARSSDGGAYTRCAQERLAAAEADPDQRDALCAEARTLLTDAHTLRPTVTNISQLYTQAERYAAFRQQYDAQAWEEAAEALDELALSGDQQVCGYRLDDFRFEILLAQGVELHAQDQPCEAWQILQQAQSLAQSLEQQGQLGDAISAAQIACQSTYTPTPTPTATLTPTPVPFVSVTEDQANLRSGPGAAYALLDRRAEQNESLQVLCWAEAQDGGSGRWYKVSLASGDEAWLYEDLAAVSGNPQQCTSIPPVPPTATPVPICYGWQSSVLPTDQITKPLIEIRAVVRDQNNQPMRGVRVHVWAYNTEFRADTGPNGEYVWAGISQPIDWNVCIFDKDACQVTPFTDNGQRANIEFRRVQKPCN
jgi:hypothetical protein